MKKRIALFVSLCLFLIIPMVFALESSTDTNFYISQKTNMGVPNLSSPIEFQNSPRPFLSYAPFHIISGIVLLIIFIVLLVYFATKNMKKRVKKKR